MLNKSNHRNFKIKTPSGFLPFHGIRKTESKPLIKITFDDDKTLKCTHDHILFMNGTEITAIDTKVNDILDPGRKIVSKEDIPSEPVFDILEVPGHIYETNGVYSHNCQFEGSSGTLISGEKLKNMVHQTPKKSNEGLSVYEDPIKGHSYTIIVDVSRGVGGDYSAFSIIDVTSMPYKQVAAYRNNQILPPDYAEVLNRIGTIYNTAYILTEINDIGEEVPNILFNVYEYEHILHTEDGGRKGKKVSFGNSRSIRGVRTTKHVKSVGCSMIKMLIEQEQLIVNDKDTINEFKTFSRHGDTFKAETGKNDDMAMTLVLFGWLSKQEFFQNLSEHDVMDSLRQNNDEEMDSMFLPFGFNNNDGFDDISDIF